MSAKNNAAESPTRRRLIYGAILLAVLVVGNIFLRMGNSAEVMPTGAVRGTVTYKGRPLNGGQIRFISRDPSNKVGQASAMIDREGHYSFAGVPVGPVTVTVNTSVRPAEDHFWKPGSKNPQPISVPAKFADPKQSGIQLNLGEGVEDHDIRLE